MLPRHLNDCVSELAERVDTTTGWAEYISCRVGSDRLLGTRQVRGRVSLKTEGVDGSR